MLTRIIKNTFAKRLIIRLDTGRCDRVVGKITPYLEKKDKIIDVGCGFCLITNKLKKLRYDVVALDVRDISIFADIKPIVYNGVQIPFKNDQFNTALLITVLHHTRDPYKLLKEVKRVTKKIVVVEDIYNSDIQKINTYIMDSIVNFEFFNHPHSNKTDSNWKAMFKRLNLKLIDTSSQNFWKFFTSATYFLEK